MGRKEGEEEGGCQLEVGWQGGEADTWGCALCGRLMLCGACSSTRVRRGRTCAHIHSMYTRMLRFQLLPLMVVLLFIVSAASAAVGRPKVACTPSECFVLCRTCCRGLSSAYRAAQRVM